MREIKFRGKKDVGKWVYGDLVINCTAKPHIIDENGVEHFIIPNTVGQYTNKKDKEGKEIYEDDIVYAKLNHSKYIVRFGECNYGEYDCGAMCENPTLHHGWYIERLSDGEKETLGLADKYLKKIGNKHDNSELL